LESKLPSSAVSIFEVMSRLARERQAINLSQGFPDFGTSPALVESVAHYMREGFNQYAPMPGVLALRQALAAKIERLYGRRYDPETEIAITTGATEGLFATLTALVHPGDEVVLFQPAYDSYTPAIQLSGGVPRYVTLRYPDYRIDWDEVRRTVTARTRVIVLNTPHNPTGMVWTADDVRALAGVLAHTDAIVVSDEVYEHVRFDGVRHESLARHPDIASRAVVISSFGKTYHATGWKVGYCAAPAPLVTEILRVRQWITFASTAPCRRPTPTPWRPIRCATTSPTSTRDAGISFCGSSREAASGRSRAAAPTSRCSTTRASPTSPTRRSP
jgi:methionine aminotransferase